MTETTPLHPSPALPKSRDLTLDVLKGIGILLMVIGHSGVPFVEFIYSFHMALFFMASGYVWDDRKSADLSAVKQSILSRIRGLWIPYSLANGLFSLLHNVFIRLGLYVLAESDLRTPLQILLSAVKNLFFLGDTTLGGASWFLRTLFLVSVAHILIRYITCRWKYGKIFFGIVIILNLVATEVINRTDITLPLGAHSCFAGYTAFLLGMLLKRIRLAQYLQRFRIPAAIAAFAALLFLSPMYGMGLAGGLIGNLPFFAVASLAGWIMVWSVSALIRGFPARLLAHCGKYSIWIVLLHFLSFKAVIWLYLLITGGSMDKLSQFPVLWAPGLWPAYALAGTVLPLAAGCGIRCLLKRIRSLRT